MNDKADRSPDRTAVWVAMWRALHVQLDPPPHILEDEVGLRLASPAPGWRAWPVMNPQATRRVRASIVARGRFVEDLVEQSFGRGVRQYVILGAGLDSFAQRKAAIASTMQLFEVDQPATQQWKRERLMQLGLGVPEWLHLVPVDFEAKGDWLAAIAAAGFDAGKPAIISVMGVSMYLSEDAIRQMLRRIASLAPGTTLVMSFMVPSERVEPEERALRAAGERSAGDAGTPFVSIFDPDRMLALAAECGFDETRYVSGRDLHRLYFDKRTDGLRPASYEELLVARL